MTGTRRWALGFLVWTVLGLLSASQSALILHSLGQPVPWRLVLTDRLIDWYSCAIFTPLFFLLARRFPLGRGQWRRYLPLHLAAAAVASVAKFGLQHQLGALLIPERQRDFSLLLTRSFITENMAFWCVIAAVHALEYYERFQERELQAARLRARLSEAELEALAGQLHPHFLFNTLQGISTLIHRDPEAADEMLVHLSDLLRKTLARARAYEVTLAEELGLLEDYLAILAVRFRDRLAIQLEIPEVLRSALVPPLLLQPLVENAIEHGIARRAGAGCIVIQSELVADRLRLSVVDDGPGLAKAGQAPVEGVGLGTTRRRLAELYGAAHSLTLDEQPVGGLRVEVSLPFHTEPMTGFAGRAP